MNAAEWGTGAVINYKQDAYLFGCAVPDVERGQFAEMKPYVWQTDTAIGLGSWGYTKDNVFRPAEDILCDLVDIVSKNGRLMLNVGPRQNLHALNNAVEIGMLGGILHTQGADTVLPVLTALQHKSVQISLRRGKAEVFTVYGSFQADRISLRFQKMIDTCRINVYNDTGIGEAVRPGNGDKMSRYDGMLQKLAVTGLIHDLMKLVVKRRQFFHKSLLCVKLRTKYIFLHLVQLLFGNMFRCPPGAEPLQEGAYRTKSTGPLWRPSRQGTGIWRNSWPTSI